MARTTADIEAELEALRKARASGVLETQLGSRRTRFAGSDDLGSRIAALERELADLEGTRRRHHKAVISKGL